MQSTFGKNLRITIDGGSHEESIGVTIEGFKEVTSIDMEALQCFMDRRAPGRSPYATRRREPDIPELVSRDPLRFIIRNTDRRSGDYKNVRHTPRPGHADYTAYVKYHDRINMAGGGPFSARMTAPLCIAGGIALQQLARKGIHIGAHIYAIHGRKDVPFDPLMETLPPLADPAFPVLDPAAAPAMKQAIEAAMRDRDSVGGIVEAAAVGLPAGLGGPMYDGVESVLSPIFFGIPAVKGVTFGAGFAAAAMRGSENNDAFRIQDGQVVTATNHCGGILGGITTGMPLLAQIAFKPTPSIAREQQSVDLDKLQEVPLVIKGRHDPCVVVRAVPICEAAMAIGLLDLMMEEA